MSLTSEEWAFFLSTCCFISVLPCTCLFLLFLFLACCDQGTFVAPDKENNVLHARSLELLDVYQTGWKQCFNVYTAATITGRYLYLLISIKLLLAAFIGWAFQSPVRSGEIFSPGPIRRDIVKSRLVWIIF